MRGVPKQCFAAQSTGLCSSHRAVTNTCGLSMRGYFTNLRIFRDFSTSVQTTAGASPYRPANPVSEIPLIICFCSTRNASVTGIAARAAAAIIGPYSVL